MVDGRIHAISGDRSVGTHEVFDTQRARVQNRILASQAALFVLLGVAILLKP